MFNIAVATFKGVWRDRIFQGIAVLALLLFAIPTLSPFSMRQVTELGITLSLSFSSIILFLLSVFLGGTALWRDIERRYSYSVLGLPISRTHYLLGKLIGVSFFLLLIGLFLSLISSLVIFYTSSIYPPDRSVVWGSVFLAFLFCVFKYLLLVAITFLFSSLSTSMFLPIFGSVAVYWVGSASQQVMDYLQTTSGALLPPMLKQMATAFYYFLPNFSAFDLSVNAIYGISLDPSSVLLTCGYFLIYFFLVVFFTHVIFSRRQMT